MEDEASCESSEPRSNGTCFAQTNDEHEQRMYGTGKADCPLISIKLYISRLSPECEAFFQTPKNKGWKSTMWYSKSPVGINTIGKFMPTISKQAKLSKQAKHSKAK